MNEDHWLEGRRHGSIRIIVLEMQSKYRVTQLACKYNNSRCFVMQEEEGQMSKSFEQTYFWPVGWLQIFAWKWQSCSRWYSASFCFKVMRSKCTHILCIDWDEEKRRKRNTEWNWNLSQRFQSVTRIWKNKRQGKLHLSRL